MKKKKSIKPILFKSFIMLNIVAAIFASLTLAKYIDTSNVKDTVTLEHFDIDLSNEFTASFNGKKANGIITLTKEEYEEGFYLSLKYIGNGKSYIRVLVEESWISTAGGIETVVFSGLPAYEFASGGLYGIHDNRTGDGYIYIKGPTYGDNVIPVIASAKYNPPADGTIADRVKIIIRIDAVQYNRYKAVWRMTELPWPLEP